MQNKTKRSKCTRQRKTKTHRRRDNNFVQDDDEIEEITVDNEDEDESDIGDDEDDDDEYPGEVLFNMTGKEDPDFSPGVDALKKNTTSLPTRRSSR